MALKDTWKNKTDGVDDVLAEDINNIAQEVIDAQESKADKINVFTKEETENLVNDSLPGNVSITGWDTSVPVNLINSAKVDKNFADSPVEIKQDYLSAESAIFIFPYTFGGVALDVYMDGVDSKMIIEGVSYDLKGTTEAKPFHYDGVLASPIKLVVKEAFVYFRNFIMAAPLGNDGLMTKEDKFSLDKIRESIIELQELVYDFPITKWEHVQSIVRQGLAEKAFKIGDQLICNHETYGELVWDIIGFDHDVPVDDSKTHSMTIQLHSSLDMLKYDAQEALYYAETELAAGIYNFTLLDGYQTASGGGKTYQFTLTKSVPMGGQIFFDWTIGKQALDSKISTYENSLSTTAIETVSVTEGNAGTALENTNHTHFCVAGSNKWSESAIRKWLNSDKEKSTWWAASGKYDRPVDYAFTKDGFLKGLDKDFVSVIGETTKTSTVSTANTNDIEYTKDCMFLISKSEAYGGGEHFGIVEGEAYPYYAEFSDLNSEGTASDTNRIKYINNTARGWWTRSRNTSFKNLAGEVKNTGEIGTYYASWTSGVAPACCIY